MVEVSDVMEAVSDVIEEVIDVIVEGVGDIILIVAGVGEAKDSSGG